MRCGASSAIADDTFRSALKVQEVRASASLFLVFSRCPTLAGPAMRWGQALSDGRVFCTQGIWDELRGRADDVRADRKTVEVLMPDMFEDSLSQDADAAGFESNVNQICKQAG